MIAPLMSPFQQQQFKDPSVDFVLQLWPSFSPRLAFFDFFFHSCQSYLFFSPVPEKFLTHSKLSAARLLFSAAYFRIFSLNSFFKKVNFFILVAYFCSLSLYGLFLSFFSVAVFSCRECRQCPGCSSVGRAGHPATVRLAGRSRLHMSKCPWARHWTFTGLSPSEVWQRFACQQPPTGVWMGEWEANVKRFGSTMTVSRKRYISPFTIYHALLLSWMTWRIFFISKLLQNKSRRNSQTTKKALLIVRKIQYNHGIKNSHGFWIEITSRAMEHF